MALVIVALPLDTWPAMAQLLIKVSLGATVYVVAMLGLWRLAGCPEGGESYLLEKSDSTGRCVICCGNLQNCNPAETRPCRLWL